MDSILTFTSYVSIWQDENKCNMKKIKTLWKLKVNPFKASHYNYNIWSLLYENNNIYIL
jgi:hypothetical protein